MATDWLGLLSPESFLSFPRSSKYEVRLSAAVTPEYSVDPMSYDSGTVYLMAGMDPQHRAYPLWDAVTTWYSRSPQGPWSHQATEYTAPQAGGERVQDGYAGYLPCQSACGI